jgi:perosamine synthetase
MISGLYDSVTGGGNVAALEKKIAEYVGAKFAIAMTNCTSAIHTALIISGVKRGDEVIVPAYTWGGTISGLLQIGAIPVFADIDGTLTLDVDDVRSKITDKTKAVIAVHLFGHPCDMESLTAICSQNNLVLIEDCAQAFGAKINGQYVGSFGIGCFSFGYNKILSAGEGGMITTNSEEIYDRIIFLTQHPLRQRKDIFSFSEPNEFALNYRIHPLTAKAVLEAFDSALVALAEKRGLFNSINNEILQTPLKWLEPVIIRDSAEHSWHRYSPKLDPSISDSDYETIKSFFAEHGCIIEDGYIQKPLYRHRALRYYISRRAFRAMRNLSLPQTETACLTRIGVALRDKQDL